MYIYIYIPVGSQEPGVRCIEILHNSRNMCYQHDFFFSWLYERSTIQEAFGADRSTETSLSCYCARCNSKVSHE
jgi:hypothetical protein